MLYGIELSRNGYSLRSLRESINILGEKRIGTFEERFKNLSAKFTGIEKDYTCFYFINLPAELVNLSSKEFQISTTRPTSINAAQERIFYDQDSQAQIISIKVLALDPYSARYSSEKEIESFLSVARLYQPSKSTTIKHDICLVSDSEGNSYAISKDTSRLGYVRDSKRIEARAEAFFKLYSKLEKKDMNQLTSAIRYHKIALSTTSDDIRLVNLWIALESLCLDSSKSIINRIISYIPPICTVGYLYSVLRAIPISMKSIWRNSDTQEVLGYFQKSNDNYLHQQDLATFFLCDEKEKMHKSFQKIVESNPLLLFRIWKMKEKIFKDHTSLVDYLEFHRKNIEWQLLRIYRTRNIVIHNGKYPRGIRHYIQHLHSYFSISTHAIIHDLETNKNWTINDALEYRMQLYDYYIERLKNYSENPFCVDGLVRPEMTLFKCDENLAWEH
jgi:hypothetical protein